MKKCTARKRIGAVVILALAVLAMPLLAAAAEKGHDMGGMQHGKESGGHGVKMGDKVWSGKIGPWKGEARLMDMKAHLAAMPGGMKVEGPLPNSHHIALSLTDAKTKKAVAEGSGKMTVTGPDGKSATSDFMVMQGHFGADVNLPKPGKYTFKAEIVSGGQTGTATFTHKVK